ncbi:MAG: leucyl/phenylalanyl-tRNA--protein transferase [Planctomycetia bacterium]|nr:leucyl/phenylalanyl-tRNA--protein transferase [Planctomycetia bacterium]
MLEKTGKKSRFPNPSQADRDGFLCYGGCLEPQWLLDAYSHGIFPWPDGEDMPILWFSPHVRTIIEFDRFHISRRLRQTLRSSRFQITLDQAFPHVIRHCATVPRERSGTWITEKMIQAYIRLAELGIAHSLEVWQENALVGGIYGVSIGGFFAGESKFHLVRDASKVALAWLVRHLQTRGYQLFDVQLENSHLSQFHLTTISQKEYCQRLSRIIHMPVEFGNEIIWKRELF